MKQVAQGFFIAACFLVYVWGVYLVGQEVKAHAAARDRQQIESVKQEK